MLYKRYLSYIQHKSNWSLKMYKDFWTPHAVYVNFHVIEMATNITQCDDNYEHSSPSLDLAICRMQIWKLLCLNLLKNLLKPNVTDNFQTTVLVNVFCSTYNPYKWYHNVLLTTRVLVMTIETVLCDLFTFRPATESSGTV